MWFPQNPKVLVVDDHYEEVAPLLKVFSQNGISYTYFDGKMDSIPERPFSSIRFVILDIDLEGRTSGLDEKTKASALAGYLTQLITIKKSPYVILFWTKHEEIIENVIHYLTNEDCAPLIYKNLEKPSKDELTLEYVKNKIFSDLNNDAFEFLLKWEENIVNETSHFTNIFSAVVYDESLRKNTEWDTSFKSILSKLACTYAGTNKIENSFLGKEMVYATKVLNQSFLENLSANTETNIVLPQKTEITLQTIAKLNKILFIETINDSIIENGKVFVETNDNQLLTILSEKVLVKKTRSDYQKNLIGVVLTPSCDIAHRKFLQDDSGNEYHRILFGLKIVVQDNESIETCFDYNASANSNKQRIDSILTIDEGITKQIESCINKKNIETQGVFSNDDLVNLNKKVKTLTELKKKIKSCISGKQPEYLYITQPFFDEEQNISIFVFHFGIIKTIPINVSSIKFSYFMKNSLISDLQTKLANHVNRLGNSMLEFTN